MTHNKLLTKRLPLTLAILGLAAAAPAQAQLVLSFAVNGGASTIVTDNNVPGPGVNVPSTAINNNIVPTAPLDTSAAVNNITLANGTQPTPGLVVNGSTTTATYGTGFGTDNILASGSSSVVNNTGAAVSVVATFSATDFMGPSNQFQAASSGEFLNAAGSVIDLYFYNDPTNTQGAHSALDTPGNNVLAGFTAADLSILSPGATFITGPNAHFEYIAPNNLGDTFAFSTALLTLLNPDPSAYSMTAQFDYTLTNGGSLLSRSQSELKPIPEPGITMLLFGAGLVGLGFKNRRKA